MSIDESLLREICSSPTESGLNFIVDSKGYVISCPGVAEIGQVLFPEDASETEKQAAYRQLTRQTGLLKGEELSVYSLHDEKTGWDIICAMDQEELLQALRQQQQLTVSVTAISLRPREIEIIAQEFNQAMDRLKLSVENQRNAEIAALEAQINPHFLYNTLDAINWMAIDRERHWGMASQKFPAWAACGRAIKSCCPAWNGIFRWGAARLFPFQRLRSSRGTSAFILWNWKTS